MKSFLLSALLFLVTTGAGHAKTFFFPHYGDGSGLSMLFSLSNLSSSPASGTIRFFDQQGNAQTLPLSAGSVSELSLTLPANGTVVITSDGSSNPVKSGYVQVDLDQEATSGVAIFRIAPGLEASVLPLEPARRYSLYVERSATLDTGVALFRPSTETTIHLRLHDLSGALLADLDWDFSGHQVASFMGQIIDGLGEVQGVLELESDDLFAPVGLRFGNGVLSTVPVFELPPRPQPYTLSGVDLGPFVGGPDPTMGARVSETRLRELIGVIAPHVEWIRTYGSGAGLENAGRIGREFGLKTALGAWLDSHAPSNETEIAALIANAQQGDVDIAIVGSETLQRGDLTPAQLIAYIDRVKAAVPEGVRVATADTFHQLMTHPDVVAAGDVVLVNYYPFFDGVPIGSALRVLHGWHQQLQEVAGQKEIIVSETGWPDCGSGPGGATPTAENSAFYFLNFVSWARANAVKYFYFEAFDEIWKARISTREGCFGLWDGTLQLKPGMERVLNGETIPDNWTSQ